jgi:replicative superfamily II helicase
MEESWRGRRGIILKLHSGQGKTFIRLLMPQSKLNENGGPAVYLCPNNYLIDQTCEQARQFGIQVCRIKDGDLTFECFEDKSINVASAQKLFTGHTKFGTGVQSISVSTILWRMRTPRLML